MTKEELWGIYVAQNPKFGVDGETVTLSTRGLKKLFEQTYDLAHAQGVANGKAFSDMRKPKKPKGDDDIMERFGKLFGFKK